MNNENKTVVFRDNENKITISKEYELLSAIFRNRFYAKASIENNLSSKMFIDYNAKMLMIDIEEAIKQEEQISILNPRFSKSKNYDVYAIAQVDCSQMLIAEHVFTYEIDLFINNYKNRIKKQIVEETEDINEVINKLQQLNEINITPLTLDIADIISSAHEKTEIIKTGFSFIDNNNIFSKKRFIVIGARASMGKSAVSQILASRIAERGQNVLFFSLEMGRVELGKRAFAIETGVMYDSIEDENEAIKLAGEIDYDNVSNLRYAELFSSKFMNLKKQIIQESNTRGIDIVFIDYLQLLQADFGRTELEKLTYITRNLKQLAMDLNICIVTPAQLNREAEEKEHKDNYDETSEIKSLPISNLRGSGTIEQDADCVLMINGHRTNRIKLTVGKNRHGKNGISRDFYMNGATMQMNEIRSETKDKTK